MTSKENNDWNPEAYSRFRGLRLRPAIDLLAAVGPIGAGDVIDLGCGNGVIGGALRGRVERARLIGVDNSEAMLETAQATGEYDVLKAADIADWTAETAPGLIFSNAALHWLPDHETLMPRLAGMLGSGGVLAVQMPHQNNAPSHRLWASLVGEMYPGRVDMTRGPKVLDPVRYYRMLSPLGAFQLWETSYFQQLAPCEVGHPVRQFTQSTFARPILAALDEDEQQGLIAAYEAVMDKAYPKAADGSVLFPFRRLFFTLTLP